MGTRPGLTTGGTGGSWCTALVCTGLYWSVLVPAARPAPSHSGPASTAISSPRCSPKRGKPQSLWAPCPMGMGAGRLWRLLQQLLARGWPRGWHFSQPCLVWLRLPAPSPRGGAEGNTSTTRSCFSWWVSPVLSCPPPAFVLLPPTLGLAAQAAPCAPQCLPCAVTLGRGWVKNNPTNPLYPRIPFFIPRSPFPRRKKAQSQRSEPEALPQNPGCPPPPTHSEGHRAGRAAGEGAGGSTGGSSRPAPGRGQSFCRLSSCRWC